MATATEQNAGATRRGKGLSPERIFGAAKEIADRDGLDALTIRKLAADLKVSPTAIYWHVRTREELLRGVYDMALNTLEVSVGADDEWREVVAAVCRAERSMMVAHPFMFTLAQQFPGRGAMRTLGLVISAMRKAGYSGAEAFQIARLLGTYAIGFGFVQTAADASNGKGPDLQDLLHDAGADIIDIVPHLVTEVSDDLFELGLGWLIAGIPAPAASDQR
jgi:AcrR family transcriptional regulator